MLYGDSYMVFTKSFPKKLVVMKMVNLIQLILTLFSKGLHFSVLNGYTFDFLCRFWISLRFHHLHSLRKTGKSALGADVKADSSLIAWAFQSDTKNSLISSLLSPESSWMDMRNIGVGFWLTDAAQLRLMV